MTGLFLVLGGIGSIYAETQAEADARVAAFEESSRQDAEDALNESEASDAVNALDESSRQDAEDALNESYANDAANAAASASAPAAGSDLTKVDFKFNPNTIAPTTQSYNKGTGNIQPFLKKVADILLIVITTGAVLSIVIGGFYMTISGGDSEKANKGKIIITYNIIAICIAMLSYAIIQFVTWIL